MVYDCIEPLTTGMPLGRLTKFAIPIINFVGRIYVIAIILVSAYILFMEVSHDSEGRHNDRNNDIGVAPITFNF